MPWSWLCRLLVCAVRVWVGNHLLFPSSFLFPERHARKCRRRRRWISPFRFGRNPRGRPSNDTESRFPWSYDIAIQKVNLFRLLVREFLMDYWYRMRFFPSCHLFQILGDFELTSHFIQTKKLPLHKKWFSLVYACLCDNRSAEFILPLSVSLLPLPPRRQITARMVSTKLVARSLSALVALHAIIAARERAANRARRHVSNCSSCRFMWTSKVARNVQFSVDIFIWFSSSKSVQNVTSNCVLLSDFQCAELPSPRFPSLDIVVGHGNIWSAPPSRLLR